MKMIRIVSKRIANDGVVRFRAELASSARILGVETGPDGGQILVRFMVVTDNDDDREIEHEFLCVRDDYRFDLPVNNAVIHTEFDDEGCVVIYHLGPVANELRHDEAV